MNLYSLSYDDGPDFWTGPILDQLQARGMRATFFVLGSRAEDNADILRRMVSLGCEIGNHGWDHTPMTRLSDEDLWSQLVNTAVAIRYAVGDPDLPIPLMRPPYHNRDDRVMRVVRDLGYMRAFTDNDPGDYGNTVRQIREHCFPRLQPGGIVNLHDAVPPGGGSGYKHRWNTYVATGQILDYGIEQGWESCTISEMVAFKGGKIDLVTDEA